MGSSGDVRVVCLGEAMVVLRPEGEESLAAATTLRRSVGGAEANVAGALAALGVRRLFEVYPDRDAAVDEEAQPLSA